MCPSFIKFKIQMIRTRMILLLVFMLSCCLGLDRLDSKEQISHYYEEYSHFPVVNCFYNRHFSSSPQFEDFINTLEEVEYRNHDHVKVLLTDCDKFKEGVTEVCDNLRRTKDNHAVIGYYPSGEFIIYAGKKMQNPPKSRQFRHPSDIYTVAEIEGFISEMMPNFYEEIDNYEDLERWLEPRYSPNLIMVTREEEIPLVVAQLGIHFFLRFDMGYLNDLTEDVVKHLNITSFPQLIVLKYNFQLSTHELYRYPGKEFSTERYEDIKTWLEPLALKTPRNDILFHKMRTPTRNNDVVTTDKQHELTELLDRANGWAFISQTGQQPEKLMELKSKYGEFFEYYHFLNSTKETETITLYDPERKRPLTLPNEDIEWRALSQDDFISNTSVFLTKNFVVMGVRQQYSYFCTLALNSFFRGLTHCFILKEEDYEATSTKMNMKFDIGFVCYQKEVDGEKKVSGNNFNSAKFQDVYLTAEYQTRLKSKLIVDDFFEKPIKSIEKSSTISELCAFPFKKCALLFTDSTKTDRTAYEYLKEVAKNFINEYQFFEIDLTCNEHFKEEIQALKKTSNGLVVYHPRNNKYVYLKAKLSRTTFQRFLKANLGDQNKLPLKEWKAENILVNSCKKPEEHKAKQEENSEETDL